MTHIPPDADLDRLKVRHRQATERRQAWDGLWRDCYAHSLPNRMSAVDAAAPGSVRSARLYDGTAPDAVERLAASLLAEITPPWCRWFALVPGSPANHENGGDGDTASRLEDTAERVRAHIDRSNFAVEMHQAFLDLVTAGTASLLFEEAPAGDPSAFRFTAVPLQDVAFEEGIDGRLATTFRRSTLTPEAFRDRFPGAAMPVTRPGGDPDASTPLSVIEAVHEQDNRYRYVAWLGSRSDDVPAEGSDGPLAEGTFNRSPFINFRWMKAPGEIYGRSPVMKALPDIKTANSVAGTRAIPTARSCSP